MRYAIVSDIHANWQAWKTVLLDIRSLKIERIISLGDLVGYGPNPCEVLESVYAAVDHFVLGNHDAALCGKLDSSLFNDEARIVLDWTRQRVGSTVMEFVKTMPLSLAGDSFRCAHGEFAEPGRFNYVFEPDDALRSWEAVEEPLLFNGHTHCPGIFLVGSSGRPYRLDPEDFELQPGKRFMVNVGSVGNPRDGDTRASYCIYDARHRSVFWRKIPFDLDAYRLALGEAGLPPEKGGFLERDPRLAAPPLRSIINFVPPVKNEQAVRDAVEVQTIRSLKGKILRWQIFALAAAALLAAVLVLSGLYWHWQAHREADIGRAAAITVAGDSARNLLPVPEVTSELNTPVSGWLIHLGDRRRQGIEVRREEEGDLAFRMISGNPRAELRFSSGTIAVKEDMKFVAEASFRKSDDFEGSAWLGVSLVKSSGARDVAVKQYVVKEPAQARRGGWISAKKTFDLPKGACSIEVGVYGRFKGIVSVKDISLECKPAD